MIQIEVTDAFDKWLKGLRDLQARERVLARIRRLREGNPGDVKPVGGGVSEMRIDNGPGYRLNYVQRGSHPALRRRQVVTKPGHRQSAGIGKAESAMSLKTRKYDVANYLDSDEMISVHLDAAFESGDLSRIAEALGDVARARGMAKISKATGLAREQLYKTLSAEGKPELSTVLKVMAAFGGRLKSNFPASGASGARRKSVPRSSKGRQAA